MNKHTPGPWKVDTQERSDGDAIAVFPSIGGVCICEVVARSGEGRSNPIIQETAEANARLIAAAPELLEALKGCAAMLAECAKQHRLDGSGEGHGTLADKHAAIARAAIDKATGE